MKIVMSSGHGKYIRGAEGPSPWGLDEVDEARRVVEAAAAVLRSEGVDVTTYHDDVSDDQDENLKRICDFHNSKSRDLDVSVHFNAYEVTSTKPMGSEVFYASSTGEKIADSVVDQICTASGLTNRGPKKGNLYFLNHTEMPAVLVEVCFVDSKPDCDIYRAKYDAICTAIAEGLIGDEIDAGRPPAEIPEPPDDEFPTLKQGSKGPDVIALQKSLGVLIPDGDFGPTTDTWVRAFQAASDLTPDGVVGPKTWDELDELVVRSDEGTLPLPIELTNEIYAMAQQSELAEFSWPDRGVPPPGYIAAMALSFAHAVQRLQDGDNAAGLMSQAAGDPAKDALAFYKDEFARLGMSNKLEGIDTLRHLFVLATGLGPRESSGKYCEGRDLSADNVQSETAEAGLFQTSYNIKAGSPVIAPLLEEFWQNPNGFLSVFKEGISPTANNLNSYGSGDGIRYQFLSRFCPLYHVLTTACGLRVLRQHWGPLTRREVTIKKEMDDLLKDVQALVESVS